MDLEAIVKQIHSCIEHDKQITFLIGAGLSVDSGIPTFRGEEGYWTVGSKNYQPEEMATFQMFSQAPKEVWNWYLYRKSICLNAKPNEGHHNLKKIQHLLDTSCSIVSQNVDGLLSRVGIKASNTYHIHGDLDYVRCTKPCTTLKIPFPDSIEVLNYKKNCLSDSDWKSLHCPECGSLMRPHVLWFDESYNQTHYSLNSVMKKIEQTGILFIIGTSLTTNLPSTIVQYVLSNNERVIEINPNSSDFSKLLQDAANGQSFQSGSSQFLAQLFKQLSSFKKG